MRGREPFSLHVRQTSQAHLGARREPLSQLFHARQTRRPTRASGEERLMRRTPGVGFDGWRTCE